MTMGEGKLFIGVDVGTGSVRAGLFTETGALTAVATKEILINNPEPGYYEQSSKDIWNAVIEVVQKITGKCDKSQIHGLSFCATCSLVAVDAGGAPVSVSKGGDPEWDIVMWMDHRAEKEAQIINATSHKVLDFVGGKISLEMQTPKLLWLKQKLPRSYGKTETYFDLGDFLRWKATGSLKRSVCSVVCKWTYLNSPKDHRWDESFFKLVGLDDVIPKIGSEFSFPGDSDLISDRAGQALGLGLGSKVKVGFSMIDAHSGVLGMIGCKIKGESGSGQVDLEGSGRLALICGTSNCHMALSKQPCNVPGVWGPYFGVILKESYLSEGGQSAAGKLLDHVVKGHQAYPEMLKEVGGHGQLLSDLEEMLLKLPKDDLTTLTLDLHVWPDFHGNRSPLADPTLRGMISGLTLADTRNHLAKLYLATIQSLAYGSRLIKDSMEKCGHKFHELVICGGLTKSQLFLQIHADILRLPVVIPDCAEPVLLGAAVSARAAHTGNLLKCLGEMAGTATVIRPDLDPKTSKFHSKKYQVFLEMVKDQIKYRKMMDE